MKMKKRGKKLPVCHITLCFQQITQDVHFKTTREKKKRLELVTLVLICLISLRADYYALWHRQRQSHDGKVRKRSKPVRSLAFICTAAYDCLLAG